MLYYQFVFTIGFCSKMHYGLCSIYACIPFRSFLYMGDGKRIKHACPMCYSIIGRGND